MILLNLTGINNPPRLCTKIREHILELAHATNTGHIASALSMVEILVCVLDHSNILRDFGKLERNRFVLSKGHGALSFYGLLMEIGAIEGTDKNGYLTDGSELTAFPCSLFPELLDFSSGSLGHGLSVGAGIAYAQKVKNRNASTYVICSDGEMQEGSVWEAVQFASHHKLNNLVIVVDGNKLQAIDQISGVSSKANIPGAFQSMGFSVQEVDGHDLGAIAAALDLWSRENPLLIWAHTIKGKGVGFMENSIDWHYLPMTEEQASIAFDELIRK